MAANDDDQQDPSPPAPSAGDAAEAKPAAAKRRNRKKKQPAAESPAEAVSKLRSRKTVSLTVRRSQKEAEEDAEAFTLDDFNPVAIGRKSRQVFDDVWQQFARLSSPSRGSGSLGSDYLAPEEFSVPAARDTTVLVAGATGRVGRILVRKLLLRGYKVRALVRGRDQAALEAIPQSVTIIRGDVGEYKDCLKAMWGADKVISCVTARSDVTGDLRRVEELSVTNLTKAYMDLLNRESRRKDPKASSRLAKVPLVDFAQREARESWAVQSVGMARDSGTSSMAARRAFDRGQDKAYTEFADSGAKLREAGTEEQPDTLVFYGSLYSRSGRAEVGGPVSLQGGQDLTGSEGLVLRLGADGNVYSLIITTEDGDHYSARVPTRKGFMTARLPFSVFRPEDDSSPLDVDPARIARLAFRIDKRQRQQSVVVNGAEEQNLNDFRLAIDWVKALPGGSEADMVLVSCVGAGLTGINRSKMVQAKRRGEDVLRASGLGYTIVRPGPLQEAPGGYKALVFDQGNRIEHEISCADVADVALKALHDGAARNKTFEVCSEVEAAPGSATYELVAHLPDRSNNYLTPALVGLEKNT